MTAFTYAGSHWKIIADFPYGSAFDPSGQPYFCAVPWDRKRKCWKTRRSAAVFPREVLKDFHLEHEGARK
jgi:hypothetical protein